MPKLPQILGEKKPKGKILRQLRSEYLTIKPTVNIGKEGVTDKVVNEIKKQLKTLDVVKITINRNILRLKSRVEIAKELQEKLGNFATIVDFRGHKILVARNKLITSLKKKLAK